MRFENRFPVPPRRTEPRFCQARPWRRPSPLQPLTCPNHDSFSPTRHIPKASHIHLPHSISAFSISSLLSPILNFSPLLASPRLLSSPPPNPLAATKEAPATPLPSPTTRSAYLISPRARDGLGLCDLVPRPRRSRTPAPDPRRRRAPPTGGERHLHLWRRRPHRAGHPDGLYPASPLAPAPHAIPRESEREPEPDPDPDPEPRRHTHVLGVRDSLSGSRATRRGARCGTGALSVLPGG